MGCCICLHGGLAGTALPSAYLRTEIQVGECAGGMLMSCCVLVWLTSQQGSLTCLAPCDKPARLNDVT